MSKLAEFRQHERHLAEQLTALEVMKGDKAVGKRSSLRANCARFWASTRVSVRRTHVPNPSRALHVSV